jgi:hypothetical protein
MLTLIAVNVILALAYGVLWHNQPARGEDGEKEQHRPGTAHSAAQVARHPERQGRS